MESSGTIRSIIQVRGDVLRTAVRKGRITLFFPANDSLEVGDHVILADSTRGARMEVSAVKVTRFGYLTSKDMEDSVPELRTPKQVLSLLRRATGVPYTSADIVKGVELIHINYDLKQLNRLVDNESGER